MDSGNLGAESPRAEVLVKGSRYNNSSEAVVCLCVQVVAIFQAMHTVS